MNIVISDSTSFNSNMTDEDGFPLPLEDNEEKLEQAESSSPTSSSKYGDGLKSLGNSVGNLSLSISDGLDVKAASASKPAPSVSARAAAAAKALSTRELTNKNNNNSSNNMLDNCLEFLQGNTPKASNTDSSVAGSSLADKLKAKVERSAEVLATKGKIDIEKIGTTKSEEEKEEKETDQDDAEAENPPDLNKRDSSGKITRGRHRGDDAKTPGPKERDSSAGRKKFTDLLTEDEGDDSDSSEDKDVSASEKMKSLWLSGSGSKSEDKEDKEESTPTKKAAPEKRSLSPRGRMGLERARSARSLSPKSNMRRTASQDSEMALKSIARPGLVTRAKTVGDPLMDDESDRKNETFTPRSITRTKSGEGIRSQIPRRVKSSNKTLEEMAGSERAMRRTESHNSEAEPASPTRGRWENSGGGRPGLLSRSPSRRGLMSKATSSRNLGGGGRSPTPPRRSDSGLKIDRDELKRSLSKDASNHNSKDKREQSPPTRGDRSLSRSASRRNLSRGRSKRGLLNVEDLDKDNLLTKDSSPDPPLQRKSSGASSSGYKRTASGKSEYKRTTSGASAGNSLRRSNSGGSVGGASDDDAPAVRSSAPTRALKAKKPMGLEVQSDHIPKKGAKKGNLVIESDSEEEKEMEKEKAKEIKKPGLARSASNDSGPAPRRGLLSKAMSLRDLSPLKKKGWAMMGGGGGAAALLDDDVSLVPEGNIKKEEKEKEEEEEKSPEAKSNDDNKSSDGKVSDDEDLFVDDSKTTKEEGATVEHRRRRHRDHRSPRGEGRGRRMDGSGGDVDDDASPKRRPQRGIARSLSEKRGMGQRKAEGGDGDRHHRHRSPGRAKKEGEDAAADGDADNKHHRPRRHRRTEDDADDAAAAEGDGDNKNHHKHRSPRRAEKEGEDAEGDADKHDRRERRHRRHDERSARRQRAHSSDDGGEAVRSADRRQRRPGRRRREDEKSDCDLSPDEAPSKHSPTRTEEGGDRGERSRARRGRGGAAQSRSASPTRAQPPSGRTRKTAGRHQNDVARSQFANMVKYADEREAEEEELEEEEQVEVAEEPEEEEEVHADEEATEAGKKKGGNLFKSAMRGVKKTAKQGKKIGAKVASNAVKEVKSAALVGSKAVTESLGTGTQHGKGPGLRSEDYLASDHFKASDHFEMEKMDKRSQRSHQPAASISVLACDDLGGSSAALLRSGSFAAEDD